MPGREGREGGLEMYDRSMVAMIATLFLLVMLFSVGMSMHSTEYQPTESLLWLQAKEDYLGAPKDDYDNDGLPNIEENYDWGTDIYDPDTDGDGMDDFWEVMWYNAKDPLTEELLIDPTDPTDAYEDPDNDGYDLNANGRIDRFDDSIVLTDLGIPPDADYEERSVRRIIQNPPLYMDDVVRLSGVYVMDNGSYAKGERENAGRQITIQVAEDPTDTSREWLTVLLQPNANRPVHLGTYHLSETGRPLDGDRVDIQGILHVYAGTYWFEVRGGEEFSNIQEYQARFAHDWSNPANPMVEYNHLDPTDPDTDDDGMTDGWEAWYGEGHLDLLTGEFVWIWQLDPTDPSDADVDMDGDAIEVRWAIVKDHLWVDIDRDGVLEPPGGASPNDIATIGLNVHEFILGTDPRYPDSDNDSYPELSGNALDMDELFILGLDPADHDTDGDGMWDGWEIFHTLMANNASDGYWDGDNDALINYHEFLHDLDPTDPDTDGDGMADGWEVEYGLHPKDPNDASRDPDEDLLINLQEYLNSTNPRDPDTDRDFLTDYEEVVQWFYVTANGVTTRYHTDPTRVDTDKDDEYDDEDGDGNYDPNEEILDGIDNDGDSVVLQNNGIDDDRDGVVDDGRPGIPAVGLPEGVDEEVDFNDYNEVFLFRTNASDPDTDGEGLEDWFEWFTDVHPNEVGIQRTSPLLADTDSDRLTDKEDGNVIWIGSTYIGYRTDPLNPDTDSDGLGDGDEVLEDYDQSTKDVQETCDPTNPDTDGDGMLDGYEFDHSDPDNDGMPTWWERENAGIYQRAEFRRDTNMDGVLDQLDDWDGDGVTNLMEYMYRLDPWNPDDGLAAVKERTSTPWPYLRRIPVYSDTDGDLMPDWWEVIVSLDPLSPTDRWEDPDHDLLVNIDEYIFDLDPFSPDTDGDEELDLFDHEMMSSRDSYDSDGDGIADWWERMYENILDPSNPEDADRNDDDDNWTNFEEFIYAADPYNHMPTDPTMTSTDGDKLADDTDPFPVPVAITLRPVNPTREVQSLSPIKAYDAHGIP